MEKTKIQGKMIRGNSKNNNIQDYGAFQGKKRKLFNNGGRESLRYIIGESMLTHFLVFRNTDSRMKRKSSSKNMNIN